MSGGPRRVGPALVGAYESISCGSSIVIVEHCSKVTMSAHKIAANCRAHCAFLDPHCTRLFWTTLLGPCNSQYLVTENLSEVGGERGPVRRVDSQNFVPDCRDHA